MKIYPNLARMKRNRLTSEKGIYQIFKDLITDVERNTRGVNILGVHRVK